MSTYICTSAFSSNGLNKIVALFVLFFINANLSAQQTTVLPGNGNYSQINSPQGGLRYQRGFYLITPGEIKAGGLANGSTINSIGFTLGAAQKDTTKGAFKVYLQNTTDTVSRVDTSWTVVTSSVASLSIAGLFPGNYEWQVKSKCASNSPYSALTNFSNDNIGSCSQPTNLATSNITTTTATFNWDAPSSTLTKYYIEYKSSDSISWIRDSTTNVSYNAAALLPGKTYQWHVKTSCSSSSSDYTATSFITNSPVSCSAPTSLNVGAVTDTSAQVSWTAAAGGSYYTVIYRRLGTDNWTSIPSFTNSLKISFSLVPGTTYEWQVRTVCSAGTGSYIPGANFTTTGTTVCYAPVNLTTNAITDSLVVFKWAPVTGATSYEVRYRLKETISWANAITPSSPMTLVHNDSLTIPKTAGPYDVSFINGSSFTYTGNGIYVAWEYSQSASALSSTNTTISTTANTSIKGVNGIDSIKYLLSFIGKSDTTIGGLPTRLVSTNLRPETRLGSSSLRDSAAVLAVYALGNSSPAFTKDSITALIKNYSNGSKTYPVSLTIKDAKTNAVRYLETQNISVAANAKQSVLFTGWTPVVLEKDSIIVSIPTQSNENVVNNNSNFYLQNVDNSIVSYDDGSGAVTQAGFDTSSGLVLVRYHVSSCGKVNSTQVYLSSSAAGHTVYAVALDASKTIVAKSTPFTPDSSQVNSYHTFYFANTPLIKNADFYVGLAQLASSAGYFPVGVQWEGSDVRSNSYFRSKLNGDNLTDQPLPGRLMIGAELIPGIAVPAITGNLVLCSPGNPTTLTAGSTDTRFADSIISFSSQGSNVTYSANKALGTPDVYPGYSLSSNAWVSAVPDGGREYLVLHFPNAARANFIDVYETLNPGAVDTVFVKDPSAGYVAVYTGTATAASKTARRNRITFPLTSYSVSEVRIAINSSAVLGFNAIDAVGIGQLVTPAVFSSYLWTGGENTQTKTVTSAGGYKLTVTDINGCQASDSVTVVTPVQVVPTITATRPATFCQGDSTILKSSQKGGNTWSTGATSDSITVKTGGSYTVTYNDGANCSTATSSPITVTVNALPVVFVSGSTVFCSGGSATFDAGTGYASYLWSTGAVTQTITVSTQGTYTVKVTNSNGCKASGSVTTTISPSLSPTISGSLSFCPGSSTTLDAGSGYSSYVWSTGAKTRTLTVNTAGSYSVSVTNSGGCSGSSGVTTSVLAKPSPTIAGNSAFCSGGSTKLDAGSGYSSYLWSTGESTQMITVISAGNYSVTVTNSNGCSGTASVTASLYAPPAPAISGNTGFCPGSSTTLNANAGYNSYLWSTGETTQSINANTVNTFTVTVTDTHGCSASNSIKTALDTLPTPTISGTLSYCGGSSTTLDAGVGYSSYLWSTGATTHSIAVSGVQTYTVTVSNSMGCSASASATTTTQSSVPPTPGPITGPSGSVCNSTGNVYSISPVQNASYYVWTVPAGAAITSGQGSTSITVSYNSSFTSGNIVVAASNACGQSPSINPRSLAVQASPAVPASISGPTSGLCGQTNKVYSINSVTSATTYTWTVPSGATIVSGQGTASVNVSFSSSFTSGSICVKAGNSCGTSTNQCVQVSAVTSVTSAISGPANVCSKQQAVYSIPAAAGAVSYTWTVPLQATIILGQGTNTVTVAFGTKGGNVTVKANNTCGSSNIQSLAVVINCTTPITGNVSSRMVKGEVSVESNIKVFPNPTTGPVTLSFEGMTPGEHKVLISDGIGRAVSISRIYVQGKTAKLDLSKFAKGFYTIGVLDGKKNVMVKVVLQ